MNDDEKSLLRALKSGKPFFMSGDTHYDYIPQQNYVHIYSRQEYAAVVERQRAQAERERIVFSGLAGQQLILNVVGAFTPGPATNAPRLYREAGWATGLPVLLKPFSPSQTARYKELGRINGIPTEMEPLQYVNPRSPRTYGAMFPEKGGGVKNAPNGRPIVALTKLGTKSERTATATMAHECVHIEDAQAGRDPRSPASERRAGLWDWFTWFTFRSK